MKSPCYRRGKFLYGINSLAVFSHYALASWRNNWFAEGLAPEKWMPRCPRRAANPVRRRPNLRLNRGEDVQEQHPPNRRRRLEYEQQWSVHQPEEQLNQPPPAQNNIQPPQQNIEQLPQEVVQPQPQTQARGDVNVQFDEPLLIPNVNEVDIFIKEKNWLSEYIDLAIMHKSNFNNQFDQQKYVSINENGRLVVNKIGKKSCN